MDGARDVLNATRQEFGVNQNTRRDNGTRPGPVDETLTPLPEVRRIRIDQLRIRDSPRSGGTDSEHVRVLAATDAPLPPIYVHYETMAVIDGMHRVDAARLNGCEEIDVQFFRGSAEEAFCLAVQANVTHGLPLTFTDRRSAAVRIMLARPELSDRYLAGITGLGARSVAMLRKELAHESNSPVTRIGRDGRVRPLSTAEGRRIASEVLTTRPDASLRQIAREAGVSVGTVRDVRERIKAGKDPVPLQYNRQPGTPRRIESSAGPRIGDEPDPEAMLDGLRRDPSLRYTESGRELLRWLSSHSVSVEDSRRAAAGGIPPHCAVLVAKIARGYSRAWQDLASELDRRNRDCS